MKRLTSEQVEQGRRLMRCGMTIPFCHRLLDDRIHVASSTLSQSKHRFFDNGLRYADVGDKQQDIVPDVTYRLIEGWLLTEIDRYATVWVVPCGFPRLRWKICGLPKDQSLRLNGPPSDDHGFATRFEALLTALEAVMKTCTPKESPE